MKPGLDIRVMMDAQEYTSVFTRDKERDELVDCLEDAGSERQEADCRDFGFHFALDLLEGGIPIRFKWYSYRWHYTYALQMHHKYFIIDGQRVISGSYNLSPNAEFNTIENTVVYDGGSFEGLAESYLDNFESLWKLGVDEAAYAQLMDEIVHGSGPVPLVFDSMSLTWEEVADFRRAVTRACPEVNSEEFRKFPERHHTCDRP